MWYGCGILIESYCPDGLISEPVMFGGGVVLESVPEWLRSDGALELEGWSTKKRIREAPLLFRVEYEAESLGATDPAWQGTRPRDMQSTVEERIWLAGMAIWLVVATGWSVGHMFQFSRAGDPSSRRRTGVCQKIRVDQEDVYAHPSREQLIEASQLHEALLQLDRKGTVWSAVHLLAGALSDNLWIPRYAMLWVALEALFGPEDAREMRFRLAQRIAFFLVRDRQARVQTFREVLKGYDLRSKVVHGGRLSELTDSESRDRAAQAEGYVRRGMQRLLSDVQLAATFDGRGRERYLDELVFQNDR